MSSTPENLLDAAEAARLLGISVRHQRRLVAEGSLRAVRIGRRVLFRREDLQSFIDRAASSGVRSGPLRAAPGRR